MKYFKYKINWITDKEGIHPFEHLSSIDVHAENAFMVGEEPDGIFYNYLISGDFDAYAIDQWKIEEVSSEEILNAANQIKNSAYFDNDRIFWASSGEFQLYGG